MFYCFSPIHPKNLSGFFLLLTFSLIFWSFHVRSAIQAPGVQCNNTVQIARDALLLVYSILFFLLMFETHRRTLSVSLRTVNITLVNTNGKCISKIISLKILYKIKI